MPTIALLTDFGYRDHYAGVMRGVIARLAPGVAIIDITHGVTPGAILEGAILLRESWRYFPQDTIFAAVVDPGVGGSRRAIAIEAANGSRFVGPDNGILSLAVDACGGMRRAVELVNQRYQMPQISHTFHGRDIFAPSAAYIASGIRLAAMGPPLAEIQRLVVPDPQQSETELVGEVIYVDAFGNMVTNISRAHFEHFQNLVAGRLPLVEVIPPTASDSAACEVKGVYSDAVPGELIAVFGSFGSLEIAVRDGSAADKFGSATGARVIVRRVGNKATVKSAPVILREHSRVPSDTSKERSK